MIINGKEIAKEITQQVRAEIVKLGATPGLAVLFIGDDQASDTYIHLKKKQCEKVGIDFHLYKLPENIDQKTVLETVNFK